MATMLHFNLHSLTLKLEQKHTKTNFSIPIKAAVGGASGRQLIDSGVVKAIPPKEAAIALKSEELKLLDVRPQWEREKACVAGSLHVPLYVKDTDNSPVTFLKKWVHLGYIGLWTGQKFTAINSKSMVAVSKLHEAGYKNLGWLAGGFNRAKDGDFQGQGDEKLQYATIGGVSYYFLKLLNLLQANSS